MSAWRMLKRCENCPFSTRGAGLALRRSLRPGRWREILAGLRRDGHFICHKTAQPGTDPLVCAGSIEWQEKRDLPSQYGRICERIEDLRAARA